MGHREFIDRYMKNMWHKRYLKLLLFIISLNNIIAIKILLPKVIYFFTSILVSICQTVHSKIVIFM